jgi:glycolate oxidase FAD binding subunit
MPANLEPRTAAELAAAVKESAGPLEILGGGSKRGLGRPINSGERLDLSRLSGITLYEPEELVLTAGCGTRLSEIEQVLAARKQMLAFEPPDLGPLYGRPAGEGTLGGLLACNLAGPRRPKAGAARDHFLGALAVNGQGEIFKTGGRVVKNVTGYDLCKLLAGSFGTLAALAEATVKVLPAPEQERTLAISGLDDGRAVSVMTQALGSATEVSAAAHLPAAIAQGMVDGHGGAATLLRLEGTALSVTERLAALRRELGMAGIELAEEESKAAWRALRDVRPFQGTAEAIWRISVPPASAAAVMAAVAAADVAGARHFYDWGGGLIWLALPAAGDAAAARIRGAIAGQLGQATGGHATLMRAPPALRATVDVFQPQAPALSALARRIKESFDPAGRFNPGRMYQGI